MRRSIPDHGSREAVDLGDSLYCTLLCTLLLIAEQICIALEHARGFVAGDLHAIVHRTASFPYLMRSSKRREWKKAQADSVVRYAQAGSYPIERAHNAHT
jgi:hypothetical protein